MKRHDYLPFGEELYAGAGPTSVGATTIKEGCEITRKLSFELDQLTAITESGVEVKID